MTFSLGEVLRAKLMLSQFNEDMKRKAEATKVEEPKPASLTTPTDGVTRSYALSKWNGTSYDTVSGYPKSSYTEPATDGQYKLVVTDTDIAGNSKSATDLVFTRDTTHTAPEAKRKPFTVTNNLNRALFEQAQLYPATRKALTDRMVAMGYKRNSVATIIQQMLRQGLFQVDDEGVLHLTVAQYTPLKSAKAMRKLALPKAKPGRKQIKVNVRNRTVEEVREERPVSSPVVQETRVKSMLRSLSILEALELYAELKKVFGDNK